MRTSRINPHAAKPLLGLAALAAIAFAPSRAQAADLVLPEPVAAHFVPVHPATPQAPAPETAPTPTAGAPSPVAAYPTPGTGGSRDNAPFGSAPSAAADSSPAPDSVAELSEVVRHPQWRPEPAIGNGCEYDCLREWAVYFSANLQAYANKAASQFTHDDFLSSLLFGSQLASVNDQIHEALTSVRVTRTDLAPDYLCPTLTPPGISNLVEDGLDTSACF